MLAIVPILVQSAATVLATVFAGIGSLLAMFRPFAYLRSDSVKRWGAALVVTGTIAVLFGAIFLGVRGRLAPKPQIDWAQVALNVIHREEIAKAGSETGELRPRWEFKDGKALFLSTPLASGGRAYGASCLLDVGGTFGSIFCLDAASGRPIWKIDKLGDQDLKGIFSSPALTSDGKYLIVGEGLHFDAHCHLICVEAATGKLHWKIDVPRNHVESSPAILGDVVVAGAGAIERADHLPAESPGYVFAVRVSDGRVLWQQDVVDPESSPAIAPDGTTYIGSGVNGCAIVALGPTGELLWKTPTVYPATAPISLTNDTLIVGVGRGDLIKADVSPAGAVLAIDRKSGEIKWRTELPDAVLGRAGVGDQKVFCPVRDGSVWALDFEAGRVIWRQKVSEAPVLAGITFFGDCVYAVTSEGFLVALEPATGKLLAKQPLNDQANPGEKTLCLSSPALDGGRLFVGSETGGLRCFAVGGDKPWR